jgi:lipoprotein-releasing system permease protein
MIGAGIAQKLLINVESGIDPIEVYFPNKTFKIGSKDAFFSKFFLMPTNSFSIYDEYDNAWVIAPMEFLEDNFPDDTIHASMVEISLTQSDKWAEVQNDLAKKLGESKLVLNRHERNQGIYQMTQIEKLLVFIILLFIMILLSLNFMGSLTMHYLEKSKNFLALLSMGATNRDLQKTYLLLGIFQGISGTLIGLTLGLLICYLQLWFGLVKMPTNSTFILQNYPIKILFKDIALICISVLLVTSFVSFLTSRLNFRNSIA